MSGLAQPADIVAAKAKLADLDARLERWKKAHEQKASTVAKDTDALRIAAAVGKARQVVEAELPTYWFRVEACLAACATLRLKEIDNCTTLLLVGPPSSGKSLTIDMFRDGLNTVVVDRVTPAAFVANTMNKTQQELEQIDLLTQIQHKVMLTRELGGILRGSSDQLKELFKVLTNVLDGKGHAPATAAHGRRAIVGDYVFCWIGGTTPIPQRTWDIQTELGSRLLFFDLYGQELTASEIIAQRQGKPLRQKAEACKTAVHVVLVTLFMQRLGPGISSAVRAIEWGDDPPEILLWLVYLGQLLAHGRCRKPLSPTEDAVPENPQRNVTLLENLARGRAMLYGRQSLDHSDLALPIHVVFSSMLDGKLLKAVATHPQGLTAADAAAVCGFSDPTARHRMEKLAEQTDIVEWFTPIAVSTPGRPVERALRPRAEWQWLSELPKWM